MVIKSEQGITLVEVLASILIASIIGVIAYSILFGGFKTFDRISVVAKMRDDADLIMAELMKELYVLKLSEVSKLHFPESGTTNYFIETKSGEKIGFVGGKALVSDREVTLLSNDLLLSNETKITEVDEGQYRITLVIESTTDNTKKIETTSEIGIIDDSEEEGE